MKWTWIGWMNWRCSIRHTAIRMCVHSAGEHLVLLDGAATTSLNRRGFLLIKKLEITQKKNLKTWNDKKLRWNLFTECFGWLKIVMVDKKLALDFMHESRFGESESNRHHPAVRHNYPIFLITAAAIMKHDELMQFSLFDLFTDRWKIVVLKSLWRDLDLREVHKKKNEEYLFC